MLHHIIPRTIAMRTYLVTTLIVTILMLVLGWIYANETKARILSEQERSLIIIATTLEQRLPSSYNQILQKASAQKLPKEEKVRIINDLLQPIVNDLSKQYPGYGMGYGSLESRLAFSPYTVEGFTSPRDPNALKIYETKTMSIVFNPISSILGSKPTMLVTYPLFYDGVIIGHSWANIKLSEVDNLVHMAWLRLFIILFLTWLGLMAILKRTFHNISAALKGFSNYIQNIDDNVEHLHSLPELQSVLNTVRGLRERFLKSFNLNPNMMMIISLRDNTYMDVNQSFLKNIGCNRHDVIGKTVDQINLWLEIDEGEEIKKDLFSQGNLKNREIKYKTLEGYSIGLLSAEKITIGNNPCILNVVTDITAKKQLDAERAHFDRLNLVGEMAASIGHEVRNPMTTVRGYLQWFNQKEDFAAHRESFTIMIEELDRANSIITEFLSLAKDKRVDLVLTDLNNIIRSIFPLLQANAFLRGNEIELELQDTLEIFIDENEMRQCILNLVGNGLDSMPDGGKVTISTASVGSQLVMTVRDQGMGMTPEVKAKSWTPFFTTKDHGTGLGLPVCHQIAQRHNATIEVETGPEGTAFHFIFSQKK